MTPTAKLTILHNTLISLSAVRNSIVSNGVQRHICTINKQRKTTQIIVTHIKPGGVQRPEVESHFRGVADMEHVLGHSKDHWTAAVMLQGVLTPEATLEPAVVASPPPVLKSPVGTPPIPHGGEDRSVNSRRDQGGQQLYSPGHADAVVAGKPGDAIWDASPSLHLPSNPLNRTLGINHFDGFESVPLEFPLDFVHGISLIMAVHKANLIEDRSSANIFTFAPSHIFNQNFTIGILIPRGPVPGTIEKVGLLNTCV